MTNYASLPPSVLAKVAQIEGHCLDLSAKLEGSRRDLQRLRIERQACVPQTVRDPYEANRESDRVLGEWQRLDDAISAQVASCEQLEKRLHTEEQVVAACKRYLHELPAGARLRVVEGQAGDLGDIRQRIKQTRDEISQLESLPVPSADLADRIRRYVDELAAKARPAIQGIGDGQSLRVLYPLSENANRVHLSGFSQHEANPLLLMALVEPDRLAERLLESATAHSISRTERDARLSALQRQMVELRYDEEASVCLGVSNGDDVSRLGSSPAWAVLQVEIEHELAVAA